MENAISGGSAPANESRSSRREFLGQLAALSAGLGVSLPAARGATTELPNGRPVPASTDHIELEVNGSVHIIERDPRITLLDALRERVGLTGTKKGCDHGACGACTVLVDGKRVVSCLTLAIRVQGKKVTTIEGLAHDGHLHQPPHAHPRPEDDPAVSSVQAEPPNSAVRGGASLEAH